MLRMDVITPAIVFILIYVLPFSTQQLTCPAGQSVNTNDQGLEVCSSCPEDTYKETEDSATSCTPCPTDTPRNLIRGSDSSAGCIYGNCTAGEIYNSGDPLQCDTCLVGTYQEKTYPLSTDICETCPMDTSTADPGATSATLCVGSCPVGKFYNASGDCEDCPVNFYKDNSGAQGEYRTCTQCPDPDFRTQSTGATSASDCNIVTCDPGTYTDEANNECIACGVDEYQNLEWQTECNDCPTDHGTLEGVTGANDISLCHEFCDSGAEFDDADQCVACEIGYYKDNAEGRFDNCTLCPEEFITEARGSTSLSACSIANCSAGSFRNENTNECEPCEKGKYQTAKWQTSCIGCATGSTTLTTGADSGDLCLEIVDSTYLIGILTIYSCSANEDFADSSTQFYTNIHQRTELIVRNIINTNVTSVNIESGLVTFVGYRCFDNAINILLQVAIESTEQTSEPIKSALQTALTEAMSSGSLADPVGNTQAIDVSTAGITDDDIAISADLACNDGLFTNLTTLECDQCAKGTFQPTGIPELCYPCDFGFTTAGTGAFGEESAICNLPNPDDYTTHPFLVEIQTNATCTEDFTDPTSDLYERYSDDADVIVTNIINSEVDAALRPSPPGTTVNFVGFRCFSPVRILLEIIMANIETTDTSTVQAVINALTAESSDGLLTDPDGTVDPIALETTDGVTLQDTLSSNNLDCPDGQQTNLASGQCEDCAMGTYQPVSVPELCFACPEGTSTPSTGTVLGAGADATSVCTVIETTTLNTATGAPCTFVIYNQQCVSQCPSGYTADSESVCQPDEDDSNESGGGGVSSVGIGVGSAFGALLFVAALAFGVYLCMRYSNALARSDRYGDQRFLDTKKGQRESPRTYPDRRDEYVVRESRSRGYSPYYYY